MNDTISDTMNDTALEIELARKVDENYQSERPDQSIEDYINDDGTLKDLSEHLGDVRSQFIGLSYEIASAVVGSVDRARDPSQDDTREELLQAAESLLEREFEHIERELQGAVRSL